MDILKLLNRRVYYCNDVDQTLARPTKIQSNPIPSHPIQSNPSIHQFPHHEPNTLSLSFIVQQIPIPRVCPEIILYCLDLFQDRKNRSIPLTMCCNDSRCPKALLHLSNHPIRPLTLLSMMMMMMRLISNYTLPPFSRPFRSIQSLEPHAVFRKIALWCSAC